MPRRRRDRGGISRVPGRFRPRPRQQWLHLPLRATWASAVPGQSHDDAVRATGQRVMAEARWILTATEHLTDAPALAVKQAAEREALSDRATTATATTAALHARAQSQGAASAVITAVPSKAPDQETFSKAQVLLSAPQQQMSIRRPREQARTYLPARPSRQRRLRPPHDRGAEQHVCSLPVQAQCRGRSVGGRWASAIGLRQGEQDRRTTRLVAERALRAARTGPHDRRHRRRRPRPVCEREPVGRARSAGVLRRASRRYRTALEAGADPTVVANWIAEVTAERARCTIEMERGRE
jgi:hypothetical protein